MILFSFFYSFAIVSVMLVPSTLWSHMFTWSYGGRVQRDVLCRAQRPLSQFDRALAGRVGLEESGGMTGWYQRIWLPRRFGKL